MRLPSKPLSPAKRLPPKTKKAKAGDESASGSTPGPGLKEGHSTMSSSANSSFTAIRQPQVKNTLSPGKNAGKGAKLEQTSPEAKEPQAVPDPPKADGATAVAAATELRRRIRVNESITEEEEYYSTKGPREEDEELDKFDEEEAMLKVLLPKNRIRNLDTSAKIKRKLNLSKKKKTVALGSIKSASTNEGNMDGSSKVGPNSIMKSPKKHAVKPW